MQALALGVLASGELFLPEIRQRLLQSSGKENVVASCCCVETQLAGHVYLPRVWACMSHVMGCASAEACSFLDLGTCHLFSDRVSFLFFFLFKNFTQAYNVFLVKSTLRSLLSNFFPSPPSNIPSQYHVFFLNPLSPISYVSLE